jgi:quinol monooxygenase YgiN
MYAQKIVIHAPMGKVDELRRLIEMKYLPVLADRPGFIAAYLLEQADDHDRTELIQLWHNHADIENFHRTGMLQASIQSLAVDLPGINIQRQGYIVRVAVGSAPVEHI